ncbi:MAG: D-alanine--D-alanine ligase [Opitutales bacterium]
MGDLRVIVLCGGASPEAEVSRTSGGAVFDGLKNQYAVELVDLATEALPDDLNLKGAVVFPALHGGFGENGRLQAQLEQMGIAFAGSDAMASRLCIDKPAAKRVAGAHGFAVAAEWVFERSTEADDPGGKTGAVADRIEAQVGLPVVVKPCEGGSSVGLWMASTPEALRQLVTQLPEGKWMAERKIEGREVTVGSLDGELLPVVEIRPIGGTYDYERKYTKGATEYLCPAPFDPAITERLTHAAAATLKEAGVRDFARLDAIIDRDGTPWFLEINTLPGLTPTSLLPKAASVAGMRFEALVARLLRPALVRAGYQAWA